VLTNARGSLGVAARVTDDVAPDTVALAFGQGHTALGHVASGVGVNAFRLLGDDAPDGLFGEVAVEVAGRIAAPVYLSATQQQFGRRIVQWTPLAAAGAARAAGDAFALPLPEGWDPAHDLPPPHGQSGSSLGHGRGFAALHRVRGLRRGLLRRKQRARDGPARP